MSYRFEIMSQGMEPLADDAYQISKGYDQQFLRKVLRKSVKDAGRRKTKSDAYVSPNTMCAGDTTKLTKFVIQKVEQCEWSKNGSHDMG